ncbi:MAG: serine/threonine-protein phosphatase [Lachnospiraceae bacterium]|nr:serine/threonine-protein phosphatase [Lachnospiraceae bacterium]
MLQNRKVRIKVAITSLIYISMIVLSLYYLLLNAERLKPLYLVNLTADFFGMLTGYVLFVSCLIDVQRTGTDYRWYFYLLNAVFFGLFTDSVAWLVDGNASLRWLNIADNTLYYMCMPSAACFFWLYCSQLMKLDEEFHRRMNGVVQLGLMLWLSLILLNIPAGFYFTVSDAGVYSRSAHCWMHQLYGYAVLLLSLYMMYRQRRFLDRYRRIAFLVYIISPVLVGILNVLFYGFSINYAVEMLVLLLMYCVVNVFQGRRKVVSDRDLALASAIQERTLPREFPPFPDRKEFDIFASMTPAREVGGDFYDFFLIDEDHLAMVIADVSDKGVPACLFMMISKVLIKTYLTQGESPGRTLELVNKRLLEGDSAGMFVTVWLAVLELSTGKGVSANAGHEHPILKRKGEDFEMIRYRHSPMMSVKDGIEYKEREFQLDPGDCVFVYTDGITESVNGNMEAFGDERLVQSLNEEESASPRLLIRNVTEKLHSFTGTDEPFDDVTMLCLRYNGCCTS